jgi:hypothetical protein
LKKLLPFLLLVSSSALASKVLPGDVLQSGGLCIVIADVDAGCLNLSGGGGGGGGVLDGGGPYQFTELTIGGDVSAATVHATTATVTNVIATSQLTALNDTTLAGPTLIDAGFAGTLNVENLTCENTANFSSVNVSLTSTEFTDIADAGYYGTVNASSVIGTTEVSGPLASFTTIGGGLITASTKLVSQALTSLQGYTELDGQVVVDGGTLICLDGANISGGEILFGPLFVDAGTGVHSWFVNQTDFFSSLTVHATGIFMTADAGNSISSEIQFQADGGSTTMFAGQNGELVCNTPLAPQIFNPGAGGMIVNGQVAAAAWDGGGVSIENGAVSATATGPTNGDSLTLAGNCGTNNTCSGLLIQGSAASTTLDGGSGGLVQIQIGAAVSNLLSWTGDLSTPGFLNIGGSSTLPNKIAGNITYMSPGIDAGSGSVYAGGFYTAAGAVSGAAAPISIDGGSATVYAPAGTPIQPAFGCVNANTGATFFQFNPAETGYSYWAVCSCGASTANGVGECKSTSLVGVTISSLATTQQICYTCWGQ